MGERTTQRKERKKKENMMIWRDVTGSWLLKFNTKGKKRHFKQKHDIL